MTFEKIFDLAQHYLLSATHEHHIVRREMQRLQSGLAPLEQARSAVAIRLVEALRHWRENQTGAADVAALLRGLCRSTGRNLRVQDTLWSAIDEALPDPGLLVLGARTDGLVTIAAAAWKPSWLAHTEAIDVLARRAFDAPSLGDGLLYAMTGWSTYQSDAQKAAVHAFLFAAPGSTTTITMPTGAGKSLCALLPAWSDSRGGTIRGGTTLVIVPTVALAIDQQQRASNYFKYTPGEEFRPQCWIGGLDDERRAIIRRGLAQGTLPILFLAPEALMNSELHDIALEAARRGTVRRLVIDEAHLVDTWGAGFRTDFQFLSTYRRQLVEVSEGTVRTLLLTATLTTKAEFLLEQLFVDDDKLTTIHAGRLRPEIGYWMHTSRSRPERRRHVLEAIRYLPRPLILYSTTPADAENWLRDLKRAGYHRVKSFTGETSSRERDSLIRAWSDGQIDIMCATSAFGLGIDKRDVRAVIHACIPENIDRFYQEVGRGGRDGCSSISLLCAEPGDFDIAEGMVKTARITEEKALPRWLGMLQSGQMLENQGNRVLISLDALPIDRDDIRTSQRNREWNEHTLLLAQRAGLLQIEAARAPNTDLVSGDEQQRPPSMVVRLRDPDRAHDDTTILDAFRSARSAELATMYEDFSTLRDVIDHATGASPNRCLAMPLARTYPDTALACGGCPACRARGDEPYAYPMRLSIDLYRGVAQADFLEQEVARRITLSRPLLLQYDPPLQPATFLRAFIQLLQMGLQQFIIPDTHNRDTWASLPKEAGAYSRMPHRFVNASEMLEQGEQALFFVPTVMCLPPDEKAADQLYRVFKAALPTSVPVVYIVPRALHLASEHGRFVERVNGLPLELSALETLIAREQIDLF